MSDAESHLVRFAKQVLAMRKVQQRFFKGDKSAECVKLAKYLEGKVDNSIGFILDDARRQRRLFPTEEGPHP